MREDDRERVVALVAQAFNTAPARRPSLRELLSVDEMRVADERGELVASLRVRRTGQFFGGRSVPTAGIASVAVAPEARGRRVAEALLVETLRELHAGGVPLSTLYPATVPVYRRCGYEYSGLRTRYRAPLRQLPRGETPECEPFADDALPEVATCYRDFASGFSGPVDRSPEWWAETILLPWGDQDVYRYLVREDGRVTGSLVYTQEQSTDRWGYDVVCRDLAWTTPGAARALLALAARHRSLGDKLVWCGPVDDPLVYLLEEQDAATASRFWFMSRLVDVPGSFEARGYPPQIEAAVDVAVDDPHLATNAGPWRIEVTGGRAKVAPADRARARAGIGTLSALWSGFLRASDARRLGLLEADDATVAALEAILAGPTPWMAEIF